MVSACTETSLLPPWCPVALATSSVAVPTSQVPFASMSGAVAPVQFAMAFESVPVTLVAITSVASTAGMMMLVSSDLTKESYNKSLLKV